MKSEVLKKLLNDKFDGELGEIVQKVTSSEKFHIFEDIMEDVQEEFFVRDAIHGISHNERVALLAMLIGIQEKLSDDELKVVIKSALYHDIGRKSATGKNHGVESARIIDENRDVLANGFNDKELAEVEFLCSIHSNPDGEIEGLASQYGLDINLAKKLMNVLKDADALDRVRLPRFGKLDADKLRLEFSKSLIGVSKDLFSTYKSIQRDLGIDFNTEIFELNKFNIIEDNDNIYIFRSLNPDNELDMDNSNTDIIRTKGHVTTDKGGESRYTSDNDISLEDVYSNVRVARSGKNNDCISFSSNSNVTLDYTAGRYVMYAVPKNGDRSVFPAGKYMLEEISKRISDKLNSENVSKEVSDILAQIDAETSVEGIRELIGESFDSISARSGNEKKYTASREMLSSKTPLLSRFEEKQFFDAAQELEYDKIIAKLTVLEMHGVMRSILPSQLTNTRLISAVRSAFSSSEVIHYGDISKSEVTEISRASVELLAIVQQMQELDELNTDSIRLLKEKILESIKNNTEITIEETLTNEDVEPLKPESIIDLLKKSDNMQIVPYFKGSSAVEYMRDYASAKIKSIQLLNEIANQFEDAEQKARIEELISRTKDKVIAPNSRIIGRRNNRGIKLAETVNLDLNANNELTIFSLEEQQKLITALNSLSNEELEKIANGDYSLIRDKQILLNCIDAKDYPNGENDYYIDYIIDSINIEDVYKVSNVRSDKRETIKEALRQQLSRVDIKKLYNILSESGISQESIPNYVVNLLLEDGYGEYSTFEELVNASDMEDVIRANVNNLNGKITAFSLDKFLGILDNSYKVPNTNIKLREYQELANDGVNEIHQDRRFAGVVLPTGAGKSFVAMAQLIKYQKKKVLYFAPQEEILNQIQKHILKYILNKSVLTLEDITEMESMSDDQRQEFLKSKVYNQDADFASELKKLKDGSLTEEERNLIKKRLLPRKTEKNDDVMDAIRLVFPHLEFHCYQGLNSKEYQELLEKNADLVIFDELHRSGAETWRPRIKKLLDRNKSAKILGITATPVRDDADHADMMKFMAENYGDFTKDEIDEKAYLAEEMYLIDAMQNKYVVEPKIVSFTSSLYSTDEYQYVVERLNEEIAINPSSKTVDDLKKIKSKMDQIINSSRGLVGGNLSGVVEVIEENIPVKLRNGRFIVFLQQKPKDFEGSSEEYVQSQTQKINNELKRINPNIDSGYLLSNRREKSKNSEAITNFENADNEFLKLLYAINMLNEGVHVAKINGEIMLRPIGSGSNILYFQQIGRVIFSIDPDNPPKEEEIPIIFDVYNNYLTRDLDRAANQTNPTSDLNSIQIVKNWINRHERIPDINSKNHDEARKAIILKRIQEKYEKYLYGIDGENLSVTEVKQIERILEIAKSIDLFDIDIPDRIVPPGERELGRVNVFEIKGEIKNFLDLYKESQKIEKSKESSPKEISEVSEVSDVLRIKNVMYVLQILSQYGFNITDDSFREIYAQAYPNKADGAGFYAKDELTLSDVVEYGFSGKAKEAVYRELAMNQDDLKNFKIYKDFAFVRSAFMIPKLKISETFSIYDITDIRKCGLLKEDGEYISAINEKGFVTKTAPRTFMKINIYTGTNYDEDGYNVDGYDIFGYDRAGYDKDGYDRDLFKRGSSINKYGFTRDKIHIKTGTHLDPNYFDFYGDYWEADPEYPDDITKRYNTHEKVNKSNINREGILCEVDSDGNYVKKFTDGFYDREGNYWKADPEFPDDITKRINTHSKINEEYFDSEGYYYEQDEEGNLVNTGRKYNKDGFDRNHQYHKLASNGKGVSRQSKTAGETDEEGFNFYGLNKQNFNREHLYVHEDGSTSILNPEGVAYDGYYYDYDDETQSYVKGEKYYDEEGYGFDGLNEDLFDRDNLYMHKNKYSPYHFDAKRQYRGRAGEYYDEHGFDYKQDYQGILGRKYDTHNFDVDGFLYELNPDTGIMEKTTKTINDDHFDRDGFYYEFDKAKGEYKKTEFKYNPQGRSINGDFDMRQIRDKTFFGEFCKKERPYVLVFIESFSSQIDELEKNIESLDQEVQTKIKVIEDQSEGENAESVKERALSLCQSVRALIEDAKNEKSDVEIMHIAKKLPIRYKAIKDIIEELRSEIAKINKKIEKQQQIEDKYGKKDDLFKKFSSKFDSDGICIETGLRYDEHYFMANGINVVTTTEEDIRGFQFTGLCKENDFLPYDKKGFKMDGTHYQTGEKYYNGYNAYGVDKRGYDTRKKIPDELAMARLYIKIISLDNPNTYKEYMQGFMKDRGITDSQEAVNTLRVILFKAGEMYPPFKQQVIHQILEIKEKIKSQTDMYEQYKAKGAMTAVQVRFYERKIQKLQDKLNTLSFDLGDK